MFTSLTVGTRPKAAINSNRWAGRTISQKLRRKDWVPPNLPAHETDIDRISHYSRTDYSLGETSQDGLRNIADRLTNGPSPVGVLQELDASELESEMAELSKQKSASAEAWGDFGAVELDATPIARAPPSMPMNWPLSGITGNRTSDDTPTSYRSGPFHEPQELQADTFNALHDPTRQANTTGQTWGTAYSVLTGQDPRSEGQDRA